MKKIVFLTATRADYGKIKSLIFTLQRSNRFKVYAFVTGMHNIKKYGLTYNEIEKDGVKNIHRFYNQDKKTKMDQILSKTVDGFSKFVDKISPDLIIVHGDRVESLAGAVVGCLNNIKTAHIEGGEVSGTVDEILRHSITKLSHIHFVTNFKAKKRLIQLGEKKNSIYVIGSPDVDIIKSKKLPNLDKVKNWYDITYNKYAIGIFHPVTTDLKNLKKNCQVFVKSIIETEKNFILIYPNNDLGNDIILNEYYKLNNYENIKILPSIKFEYYLTLLKHSMFIIGNSSSGIMEAPYYGINTINIGDRQNKRANLKTIHNCKFNKSIIKRLIYELCANKKKKKKIEYFGNGQSFLKFKKIIDGNKIWNIDNQKTFQDIKVK